LGFVSAGALWLVVAGLMSLNNSRFIQARMSTLMWMTRPYVGVAVRPRLGHEANSGAPRTPSQDSVDTQAKIGVLAKEISILTECVEELIAMPHNSVVRSGLLEAMEGTRGVVKTTLGVADLALLEAYGITDPSLRQQAPVHPFYETEWRAGDAYVRWLAQRVEKLRQAL
jgi:hypothetical protein